jgi:gliding motility-associated-like protein
MKYLLCFAALVAAVSGFSQQQTCPSNINFGTGDLSFWSATTGLMGGATTTYPAPNAGVTTIPEYTISNTAIQVITTSTTDPFGFFPTIPTVNGYAYNYSIMIGSTATSRTLGGRNPGGFTRAVTYTIDVPGPVGSAVPYTMTYAYAMVLEDGTHNSNEQPLFKATLSTSAGIIACASPSYYLPTFDNASGGNGSSGTGATLDVEKAKANGFTNSPTPFNSTTAKGGTTSLFDVWTKGWTEVTFDLAPYRGQQVTLTFESDNCRPGAHFAYAYVALRNTCAGLEISGKKVACANTSVEYSVPSLAGATYSWTVPAGWTINSGANTNIINVTVGNNGGQITNQEVNGCADLRASIDITTTPPTVAGRIMDDTTVCTGINNSPLLVVDEAGEVLKWLSSTDGVTWQEIGVANENYTAQNLIATTRFAALVQNGTACNIDTSDAALITVDPKSVGGKVNPNLTNICLGQNINPLLTLSDYAGAIVNWQLSYDNSSWSNVAPVHQDQTYQAGTVSQTTYYRSVVKNGVCPADTSEKATLRFYSTPMPAATIAPDSSSICYGKSAVLNATITTGTSYAWSNNVPLNPGGSGSVPSVPYALTTTASPLVTSDVVLTVNNAGCPNSLKDTFKITVADPIIVDAGNDTAVVINQPLQFNATVNDPNASSWSWTPATGLNFTTIPDPVGLYTATAPASVTYIITARTMAGCTGSDTLTVKIFKTPADIFVPSAFTPNGDGRNEVIRPVLVGIQELKFFRVYNRWGQLVFSTSQANKGWDGTIAGAKQTTQNFVYMVQAVDYTGKEIVKRGNFVLIR